MQRGWNAVAMKGRFVRNEIEMREVAVLCLIFGEVPGWTRKKNLNVATRRQKLIVRKSYEYYSSF